MSGDRTIFTEEVLKEIASINDSVTALAKLSKWNIDLETTVGSYLDYLATRFSIELEVEEGKGIASILELCRTGK